MRRYRHFSVWPAVGFGALSLPARVSACAVCFGQPDSDMARGLDGGVLFLLIVVGVVLTGVAACFVVMARRTVRFKAEQREYEPGMRFAYEPD